MHTVHPVKAAIDGLHHASTALHEATQDLSITAETKKDFAEILLGLLPGVIEAAQGLWVAATTYLMSR